MKFRLFLLAAAVCTLLVPGRRGSAQEQFPYQIFDRYLGPLIQDIGMPGLSAIIVQGGRIAWSREYGYADLDRKIPATIDTPYPVGGITQALTGVLVGVCIDRFALEIDQDIRTFAPAFPVAETRVRQVLAHATGGTVPVRSGAVFLADAGRRVVHEAVLPPGDRRRSARTCHATDEAIGPRTRSGAA